MTTACETVRTDLHRPGAIVDADYEFVAVFWNRSYDDDADWIEAYSSDSRYVVAMAEGADVFVGNFRERGACDSCGARFGHGSLMRHVSGQLVHFGWMCVDRIIGASPEAVRARANVERRREQIQQARRPATDRQIRYLRLLASQAGWPVVDVDLSLAEASGLIDECLAEIHEQEKSRPSADQDSHRILSKFRDRGFTRV